jgi:flagellar assembly protein FliH
MIIKKKDKQNNPDNPSPAFKEKAPPPVLPEFFKPVLKERQERRRGDRRRGYRRTDDRNLISRAQEEANAIKESASGEGFEYGLNLSKECLKELNAAINDLISAKEKVMMDAIPDISVIAVKAAEKLIRKELELDEKVILNIISEVIKSIGRDETEIIIKANPNDTEIVRENLPEIYPYSENTKITVIPDETVDWGSCIVQTRNGVVDARFSTQLQVLQKALEAGL